MASEAAARVSGEAAGARRMLLNIKLNAFERYEGSVTGSCKDILMSADVRADRYDGRSEAFDLISGGDDNSESRMVGRFVRVDGLGPVASFGGGESRWARRE